MMYAILNPEIVKDFIKKSLAEQNEKRILHSLIQSHVLSIFTTQNTPRCPDAVLPVRLDKPSANGVFCFNVPYKSFSYNGK